MQNWLIKVKFFCHIRVKVPEDSYIHKESMKRKKYIKWNISNSIKKKKSSLI